MHKAEYSREKNSFSVEIVAVQLILASALILNWEHIFYIRIYPRGIFTKQIWIHFMKAFYILFEKNYVNAALNSSARIDTVYC